MLLDQERQSGGAARSRLAKLAELFLQRGADQCGRIGTDWNRMNRIESY